MFWPPDKSRTDHLWTPKSLRQSSRLVSCLIPFKAASASTNHICQTKCVQLAFSPLYLHRNLHILQAQPASTHRPNHLISFSRHSSETPLLHTRHISFYKWRFNYQIVPHICKAPSDWENIAFHLRAEGRTVALKEILFHVSHHWGLSQSVCGLGV